MKASFRFSPKILARLGEELNQSFDHSVLELVKNAYDADAKTCTVELIETAQPGGSVIVSDDGDGMETDAIVNGWLVLGSSWKTTSELTKLGRTAAGSKGLGRLAAIRMGKKVRMLSIPKGNSRRLHDLSVDWEHFETAKVVEDINLDIETRKNATGGHGTRVELLQLRTAITNDEVRRMARSLLLLTDPFGDRVSGFQVRLIAPEFKEVENLLKKKYFDFSEYHLQAYIDKTGNAVATILDWKGGELARADLATLRRKTKNPTPYAAPTATFDLWTFNLASDTEVFSARKISPAEIRPWLRAFGGVHVYQGDIRVAPYGNAGNDWLEMNLARARSPEERPSTNNSIGRMQIHHDGAHVLRQKTDRTGFIEDKVFLELRTFALDALAWLARWRLDLAQKRRERDKKEVPKAAAAQRDKVEVAISKAPPLVRKAIQEAFSGYEKSRDKEADGLRKEVQLYRTLSTAGITAATFSHESQGNPLKVIDLSVNALKSQVPKVIKEPMLAKLMRPIRDIEKASANLSTLGSTTLSLVRATKRRIGKVLVHEVINRVVLLFEPFVEGRSATIERALGAGTPFLRTSEAALESVLVNFINNSLSAFERAGTENRHIRISTTVHPDEVEIHIADSGPGIKEFKLNDIWLPGVTANPEGTGLGLTIVQDTVSDMGGSVSAEANCELGGAEFIVKLPTIRS